MIYAKVQMTGNWPQTPDCVIISPSTTACSSAGGKDSERLERKENKKIKWVKISRTQTKPPQTSVFSFGECGECEAINSTSLCFFFFFFNRHHCSALIVVVLFVRVQAGPGRGGGIKKKKGQFDGCLLISRPLGLWLPNIKPAITGQSSHLHLHTPSSRIGSNWLFSLSLSHSSSLSLGLPLSQSIPCSFLLSPDMLISWYWSRLVNCQLLSSAPYWRHNQRERNGGRDGERGRGW